MGGNVKHLITSVSECLGAVITSNNSIKVTFELFLLPKTTQAHFLLLLLMNQAVKGTGQTFTFIVSHQDI